MENKIIIMIKIAILTIALTHLTAGFFNSISLPSSSLTESTCALPIAGGLQCSGVCGTSGGWCYNCSCYCRNQNTLDEVTNSSLNTLEPNCTASTDPAKNEACNCQCAKGYPGFIGKSCSIGGISTVSSVSDICTCYYNRSTSQVSTPPVLTSLTCHNFIVAPFQCSTMCRYGGQCAGPNVCLCNCPTTTAITPFPGLNALLAWALADPAGQNRCPILQRVTDNSTAQSRCNALCPPGTKYADVCRIIPLGPLGPILNNIVLIGADLGLTLTFCTCTPNCDTTTCDAPSCDA